MAICIQKKYYADFSNIGYEIRENCCNFFEIKFIYRGFSKNYFFSERLKKIDGKKGEFYPSGEYSQI